MADTPTPAEIARRRVVKWEVFRNPDEDGGGWFSYVEDDRHYLGGDLHKTRAKAEAHAKSIARRAELERMEARDGE